MDNTVLKLKMFGGCDHWSHFFDVSVPLDKLYENLELVFEYNDHEYNRLWRCWNEIPTEKQREYTAWDPIDIDMVIRYLLAYKNQAIAACETNPFDDDYRREYDKAIICLRELKKYK